MVVAAPLSQSAATFLMSIRDAEDLLAHHAASGQPPPPSAEVLKRAGLVMALTAWETYVEDRVAESVNRRFAVKPGVNNLRALDFYTGGQHARIFCSTRRLGITVPTGLTTCPAVIVFL